MNLPDVAVVLGHRADPSEDLVGVVERNAADLPFSQRVQDLLSSRREVRPIACPSQEPVIQQSRGLIDEVDAVLRQVEDAQLHRSVAPCLLSLSVRSLTPIPN